MTGLAHLMIHRPFDDQVPGPVGPIELTPRVQAIIDMGYATVVYLETEPVASKTRTRRVKAVDNGEPAGVEQGGSDRDADAVDPSGGAETGGEDLRRLFEEGE